MDVRAHTAMVFHLDKCIGCHTCSLACKNIWTERPGAETMWWNNVETKPGTGYPTLWEDQEEHKGGWTVAGGKLALRSQNRLSGLAKLFYNPHQPGIDDYYEPWTYRYGDLFSAPAGDVQPTAAPVSQLTGQPVDIDAGPNWDDDLSGSALYAENDPNLAALSESERRALFEVESLAMMYLPRICNHCANPSCVASCPSGALYKRGEDGIVLIDQETCRGWRACVAACPYKKIYFNWKTGKSEKCILCYPRLETGQPPACFHACVGRIRFMGAVLYDADRLEETASVSDAELVEAQRALLLDPNDPEVVAGAEANGVAPEMIDAAHRSPVWKFVKEWGLALPLHPELRTLPMLFYVPPLLPVVGRIDPALDRTEAEDGNRAYAHAASGPEDVFAPVGKARIPLRYLASLFSAGDVEVVERVMRRLLAVRYHMRAARAAGEGAEAERARAATALSEAGLAPEDAEAIYRLTALATLEERYVLPPLHREESVGLQPNAAESCRQCCGLGTTQAPGCGRVRED